ncbi:MAG: DUF1501 domain-containing protein [Bacteroidota bacterium]
MSRKRTISRRQFLGQASCAAVGSTAFLSSVLNLGMINTASARPHILTNCNDYKAMVCILLAGGADSFNMLVPTTPSEYAEYQAVRADLALGQGDLINVTPSNTGGKTYGIHGSMAEVGTLFNDGNLAFLSNIGTLVEPIVDADDLYNGKQLPLGLYSHSDQIMHWQTSVPQDRSAVGVGGRMADMLKDMCGIDGVSMNISLAGKNRFQAGNNIIEFSVANNATPETLGIEGYPSWWSNNGFLAQKRDETISSLVEDVYSNIFQDTYGSLSRQTIDSIELFRSALAKKQDIPVTFSESSLSQDMKMIADIISVQQHLGNNRQIFFVTFGGWDHHDEVIQNQNRMLPVLSRAMNELYQALTHLNRQNDVVTFTISDFSRTLTSNGNGSDHAWGGNSMIMGGAIDGGKIYGNYPILNLNEALNIDERGRFVPTTSVDEFYAELALWFGASPNDLNYILPNLCNFYTTPISNCPQPVPSNYAPIGIFLPTFYPMF